jgi:hypothetical protein
VLHAMPAPGERQGDPTNRRGLRLRLRRGPRDVAIVAAAGVPASDVPSRRALRVNPMVVLRSE